MTSYHDIMKTAERTAAAERASFWAPSMQAKSKVSDSYLEVAFLALIGL